jgi:hypothetical protein
MDAADEIERLREALRALGSPNWRVRPTAGDAVTMAHFAADNEERRKGFEVCEQGYFSGGYRRPVLYHDRASGAPMQVL